MKTRSRIILRHIIMFVVFVAIGGTLALLVTRYVLKIPAPRPVVPHTAPNESYRVICSDEDYQFSMVCPPNWDTSCGFMIGSWSQADRPFSGLGVGHLLATPTLYDVEEVKTFSRIDFQGKDAYCLNEVQPPRKMFGSSYYSYSLFFEREGVWFQLSYSTSKKLKEFPPPIIIEYFNTFRIEDENEAP